MGNCDCGHCDCEKDNEPCECNEDCACTNDNETTEEKAAALKKSISKAVSELGYAVEETEEGIRIRE